MILSTTERLKKSASTALTKPVFYVELPAMKIPTVCLSLLAAMAALLPGSVFAELKLSSIIGDNMVLQRDMDKVPVWGWAAAGTDVKVEIAGQSLSAKAGDDGRWEVKLAALKTNAKGLEMKITAGSESVTLKNILVGEVWVCSGQSNMGFAVQSSYDGDLEALTANHPNIRLISVPQVGTQEIQNDFEGQWEAATSANVPAFSAVGWFFGKQLSQTLNIPIGLIDNAWGGSAAEAWVKRGVLDADPDYADYIAQWKKTEATYDHEAAVAKYKAADAKAKAEGKRGPRAPRNPLTGQHRPGNLYAGVLHPIIGYGIRGTIWYQGESNASRAWNYRKLFPKMITHWREEWGQGDFPFYWVQLADFYEEVDQPGNDYWPVLREAQTYSLTLPNTGEAVIYDIGEGRDIHPRNKEDVGKRLARWALAKDYGIKVQYQSPTYKSHEVKGNKVAVTFDHVGGTLRTFDVANATGFEVAGEDKVFHWANASISGKDQVIVSSDKVANPVAVRYAWSNNPRANLRSIENLPATPFRTDDWKVASQPE